MNDKTNSSPNGRLFVISGPSGSGKSTLSREVIKRTNARLSISATTRKPGPREVNGKDYFFISEKEFQAKINAGEFLEYARVFENYYGTPARQVLQMLEKGQSVVLEIDVQGAAQVFQRFPLAIGILILPPSREELQKRLYDRRRDDPEIIARRLAKADAEIDQARLCENFKYTVINDDLNEAIARVVMIISQVP